ncbi:MAG: gamma-glutamyltransferase, partial [Acidimicrobiales bacterium]
GGTAYLAAADESGMCVSLIQSNYRGFGSGITVPDWGINLHNRGCFFSLDPEHANVVAPSKRPMHTLMPAMALREGRPSHVFGTMGGDGQPQIHVQLLARMIDDACDLQPAVDAPRWILDLGDWSVVVEDRFDPEVVAGLRALGHEVKVTSAFDDLMGHAHVLGIGPDRIVGAVDPRSEGAVVGF